ncbi:MAG: hypothetical protein U0936_26325 [Planctomycetaceae bacterium]
MSVTVPSVLRNNGTGHGTFARFRMVVSIDRLDIEMNSSRDTMREGPLLEIARDILRGAFKIARKRARCYRAESAPGAAAQRIADSPTVRRPLVTVVL